MAARLITSAQALDMLETVAPRPWARRMLAWHVMETTGALEFYGGKVIDKINAFALLEHEKNNNLMDCEKIHLESAQSSNPIAEIQIGEREIEGQSFSLPVETALWLEEFDWETGSVKGSLQHAVFLYPDGFEDVSPLYSDSWLEVDLYDLRFDLTLIEMLAPNAPAPLNDLLSAKQALPQKREGGPGRRRKHDWDGALMSLIGEAERNSIAADPDAHGAQADIAARLADWFATRDLPIPANSQLQERARDVLASIRAANP